MRRRRSKECHKRKKHQEDASDGLAVDFTVGGRGMPVSILQYADDTLCIREASMDNLRALKVILGGFEMVSRLKIGRTPFKYQGLPVGVISHLFSTWVPMLDAIRRKLGSWGLLSEWEWKLLEECDELWKKIVVAKYGTRVLGKVRPDAKVSLTGASSWWRDICRLDRGLRWFSHVAVKELDKIPTRQNLYHRGVIQNIDVTCPMCRGEVESSTHLFLHCQYAAVIW
ncbi:hypothetical protein TSUD_100780 [Trifolium subterraneum]|uniref:Reverse transcriptase zinc-binding domain-containing protein n=1 Tax=Trifolium subterraneum TaxID=3900 RepID=A0A2Z6NKH3_TRISU|nr:hypothetical protein TSUD_100780 [Trifolium subterraneum]